MSLKELTKEQHNNAERQKFASILLSGKINKISYLRFLFNQRACYGAIENHSNFILPRLELKRYNNINKDIKELKSILKLNTDIEVQKSTIEYVNYVKNNINTYEQYIAHVYVRYLGDLRGGQIIARKIPGNGMYYNFQNPNDLAKSIYELINDDMAKEAKIVFSFASKLFVELYDEMKKNKEII
tara:strand:+ start:207 stop:761 length:555 start_codon:yes stop_codon:yes gene_type:complete